nr:hypothetical protein [Tanacetum cinerariifolium]
MDFDLNNQNDQWELKLDIDDSDLRLTPVMRPCSSTRIETSTTTEKPVRIIPGHAGIVQASKLLKQTDIQDGGEGCVMSTQEYIKKVVEDVGEDEDFKSGSWVNATEFSVCENVNDEDDQYKLDEEASDLALEEKARAALAEHEWLKKCRKEQELDEEHERQL